MTRLVKGFSRLPREERLWQMGFHSLNMRRLHGGFFIPPVQPGLRGHPLKVLNGPNQLLRRTSFSVWVVTFSNRFPTSTVSVNFGQLLQPPSWFEMEWFVSRIPVIHPSPIHLTNAFLTQEYPHDYSIWLEYTFTNSAWIYLCDFLFHGSAESFLPQSILPKERIFNRTQHDGIVGRYGP